MKTFKVNDETLRQAAQMVKDGNAKLAEGKKQSDAGKAMIETWLKENRDCDLASLPVGEIVNLESVCLVEIGKQTRFNEKRFAVEHPELFASYREEMPVKRFKPLV
jgi:hypothetical protein